MNHTEEEKSLVKAIYAALSDNQNGEGCLVYTYNDFVNTHGMIGIDGDVDLWELSRLILKHWEKSK